MPQKYIIVETQDEVLARQAGVHMGKSVGYKQGFNTALILCVFAFLAYLFFTLSNIEYLHGVRKDLGNTLKAKLPEYSTEVEMLLPDSIIVKAKTKKK